MYGGFLLCMVGFCCVWWVSAEYGGFLLSTIGFLLSTIGFLLRTMGFKQ